MTDMHVLVTGAAGYVGSAVTACPLDCGSPVVVLDNRDGCAAIEWPAVRLPQSGNS